MKKAIIIALLNTLAFISFGQYSHTHKLSLGVGNEWNAFLSPSSQLEDGELIEREDLWDNGAFQAISLKNAFKLEEDKYRLKWKANGSLGIYQTEANSNRYTFQLGTSYRLKYASKKYLEFAPDFFRKRRQGTNADNAVLVTPFSYSLLKVPLHLDFYLGNKSWLKTQTGYIYKNYDKEFGEQLFYGAPFISASLSKKWDGEVNEKKVTLSSNTQSRKYTTRSIDGEFDPEDFEDEDLEELDFRDGSRDWTYQFTDLTLAMTKIDSKRKLEFGMHHMSRLDRNQASTFHEIGPGIKLKTESERLIFQSGLKYTTRRYTRLVPGSENDQLLIYNYLRANMELACKVSKKGQLYAKGQLTNRASNNPNLSSLSFRDYTNGFVELGVKFGW